MFSKSSNETKIAVLEERLTSYEIMIKKIDEAIQIMGKTSQTISKMLAVHEEKLDNTHKNDELIIDRIKTMESKNTEEHHRVIERFEFIDSKINDRIEILDKKVDEVTKFRWLILGGVMIISFIFSQSSMVVDILTPDTDNVRIEKPR
ncbi:hypothetical protein [Flavobacterium sp.]|uniref:DUF7201 family protein n=1 Tax=Flavobacterium sp. TaxID=239 RepID=UPI0038FCE200